MSFLASLLHNMSDLIDITLKAAYRLGGQIKTVGQSAQVAQCVADDLITRNKAILNEPAESDSDSDGGE